MYIIFIFWTIVLIFVAFFLFFFLPELILQLLSLLLLFSGTPYYWFPYCINFYAWSAQEIFVASHMCWLWIFQWCSLSMISTWSHWGWWSPISLHMWSATPDFSTSPRVTAFWCSWSLTLRGWPFSPLYFLLQLHGIAYTQSLVMFSSGWGGLTQERYLQMVIKLLKVVQILYGLQILCIFSDNPFT